MTGNSNPTQCDRLIEYMTFHPNGITQIEALSNLGILRLASRISELREDGCIIEKEMIKVTNKFGEKCHVAKYRLVSTNGRE